MNSCTTPLEKLVAVKQALDQVSKDFVSHKRGDALGADDLFPSLLYLLIKVRAPKLASTWCYLDKFTWSLPDQSFGYVKSVLEAAVVFLRTSMKLPSAESTSTIESASHNGATGISSSALSSAKDCLATTYSSTHTVRVNASDASDDASGQQEEDLIAMLQNSLCYTNYGRQV